MARKEYILFDKDTQAFIYNMQTNAVQRMLDFDSVAGRKTPSVAAIINPTGSDGFQKFFFGSKEILVPVYKSMKNAMNRHKNVDEIRPALNQAGPVRLAQLKFKLRRLDNPQHVYQKLWIEPDFDWLSFIINRHIYFCIACLW